MSQQGRSPRGTEEGLILGRWGAGGLPPENLLKIVSKMSKF